MTSPLPHLVLLSFALFASGKLTGQTSTKVNVHARWELSGTPRLVINVADFLTPAQREIIHSGFTTFSVLTIDDAPIPLPHRTSCTVKYDTWEDRYEITRLDPLPVLSETVKDYRSWSARCLEIEAFDPKLLKRFASGAELSGSLSIRQSTPTEGAKIKSWLVKQQAGFMQGLYAHMLGDFQYQQRSIIKITIPAKQTKGGGS